MVLSLFIEAHEKSNAAALLDGLYGRHQEVLHSLAVEATVAANTAISDVSARATVAAVEERLVMAGQITKQPQPAAVLDLLINHHTLVRIGASGGVSFQHEQIQEWYASLEVEDLMLAAAEDRVEARAKLRTKILNLPFGRRPSFLHAPACRAQRRKTYKPSHTLYAKRWVLIRRSRPSDAAGDRAACHMGTSKNW